MQSRRNIPALDGLRGLASLAVMTTHAVYAGWVWGKPLELATFGVWGFFTLSGFLMAYHYLPGQRSLRYWAAFIIRRLFRVYPLFFLLVLLLLLFSLRGITFVDFKEIDWPMAKSHWLLESGKSILWTIPVEIKFYGMFVLLGFAVVLARIPYAYMPLAWISLWGTSLIIVGTGTFSHYPLYALLPHLPFFLGGVTAGAIHLYKDLSTTRMRYVWDILALLSFGTLVALIYHPPIDLLNMGPDREFQFIWFKSAILTFTVLAFAQSSVIVPWIFGNSPMSFLGKISYSLYLLHHFVLYSTDSLKQTMPFGSGGIYVLTIIISFVSYKLLEEPFHILGKRLAKKVYSPQKITPQD